MGECVASQTKKEDGDVKRQDDRDKPRRRRRGRERAFIMYVIQARCPRGSDVWQGQRSGVDAPETISPPPLRPTPPRGRCGGKEKKDAAKGEGRRALLGSFLAPIIPPGRPKHLDMDTPRSTPPALVTGDGRERRWIERGPGACLARGRERIVCDETNQPSSRPSQARWRCGCRLVWATSRALLVVDPGVWLLGL